MQSAFEGFQIIFTFLGSLPWFVWVILASLVFLRLAVQWDKQKHLLFKLTATRQLKRLRKLKTPTEQLTYLRSVNPFVFEEMILTALKQRGHKIKRNKRYSGDGGIDGQVFIRGRHYLIQAKRYKGHINPAHVRRFANLCRRQETYGLFAHTGKTGKKSQQIIKYADHIYMISGLRLLKILTTHA